LPSPGDAMPPPDIGRAAILVGMMEIMATGGAGLVAQRNLDPRGIGFAVLGTTIMPVVAQATSPTLQLPSSGDRDARRPTSVWRRLGGHCGDHGGGGKALTPVHASHRRSGRPGVIDSPGRQGALVRIQGWHRRHGESFTRGSNR
jgi:hypothetical protein